MISRDDIENLAQLARLKLNDAEAESLQNDISNILGYVETVSTVEMAQTGTGREIPPQHNVMRDDTPRSGTEEIMIGKEKALQASFPTREGTYNVVRKIIQKDE